MNLLELYKQLSNEEKEEFSKFIVEWNKKSRKNYFFGTIS